MWKLEEDIELAKEVLRSAELVGREIVAFADEDTLISAGTLTSVHFENNVVRFEVEDIVGLWPRKPCGLPPGMERSASAQFGLRTEFTWCSHASVERGAGFMSSFFGNEHCIAVAPAELPHPPYAWTPALWFQAPEKLAYDGWMNLPLDPNDAAKLHKGIQIEVRSLDDFSLGFVEEQFADLVCLDGPWPCSLRVIKEGIVSKGGRPIHANEIIQLDLGDEITVRGLPAVVSMSADTRSRWYRSVAQFPRTMLGSRNLLVSASLSMNPDATNRRVILMALRVDMHTHPLSDRVTRVGRGPDNDIVVTSREVGRRHCRFERRGGHDWVIDEGSIGGTTVNGKRIATPYRLMHGDVVEVANGWALRYESAVPVDLRGIMEEDNLLLFAMFNGHRVPE